MRLALWREASWVPSKAVVRPGSIVALKRGALDQAAWWGRVLADLVIKYSGCSALCQANPDQRSALVRWHFGVLWLKCVRQYVGINNMHCLSSGSVVKWRLLPDCAGGIGPMLTWDGCSGESVDQPMAPPADELAMLMDFEDDAVGDPDEKRWFARQTRQKKAQKLYRHAITQWYR